MRYIFYYFVLCAVLTAIPLAQLTYANYRRLRPEARTIRNLVKLVSWIDVAVRFPFTPILWIKYLSELARAK